MEPQTVATRRLGIGLDSLDDDVYVSTTAAAAGVGKTPETLRRWRQRREHLPFVAVGAGIVMYRVGDLRDFLKSSRVEPVSGRRQ